MMKNKIIIIFIIGLLLMISGCKKFESADNFKDSNTAPSTASAVTNDPTNSHIIEPSITPTIVPSTAQTLTPEELSMEAYKKFLKNETKVSFDHFMPNDNMGEALYKNGSEYTLLEVLDIVTQYYFKTLKIIK